MKLLDIEPEPRMTLDIEPLPPPTEIAELGAESALARESSGLVAHAKALQITDAASFTEAGDFLQAMKDKAHQIEDFFRGDIERAYAAWKGLTTKRASFLGPLDEAIAIVSGRYAKYARDEKLKAEREKREHEEAIKQQEQERLRAEAEALKIEALRLSQEALNAESRDESVLLESAADDARREADQLRVEALTVEAPVLPLRPSVEPPKGVTVRSNWTFELTSFDDLIKAVMAGKVSREALLPNEVYLRSRARADKGTCQIPGIRVYDALAVSHKRRP